MPSSSPTTCASPACPSRRRLRGGVTTGRGPSWSRADELAEALSRVLRPEDGWYTDFAVGDDHVVVFAERVFRYRQGDEAGLAEAVAHGRSVGTPEHQLDWES